MDPVFVIPGSSVTCHTFCLRDVNVRCVNARLFVSNMLFFLHFGEKKRPLSDRELVRAVCEFGRGMDPAWRQHQVL